MTTQGTARIFIVSLSGANEVRQCDARCGLAGQGSGDAMRGVALHGDAWLGPAMQGRARIFYCVPWWGERGVARLGYDWLGVAMRRQAMPGRAGLAVAGPGVAWQCEVRHGLVVLGQAWQGLVWYGDAAHGKVF